MLMELETRFAGERNINIHMQGYVLDKTGKQISNKRKDLRDHAIRLKARQTAYDNQHRDLDAAD